MPPRRTTCRKSVRGKPRVPAEPPPPPVIVAESSTMNTQNRTPTPAPPVVISESSTLTEVAESTAQLESDGDLVPLPLPKSGDDPLTSTDFPNLYPKPKPASASTSFPTHYSHREAVMKWRAEFAEDNERKQESLVQDAKFEIDNYRTLLDAVGVKRFIDRPLTPTPSPNTPRLSLREAMQLHMTDDGKRTYAKIRQDGRNYAKEHFDPKLPYQGQSNKTIGGFYIEMENRHPYLSSEFFRPDNSWAMECLAFYALVHLQRAHGIFMTVEETHSKSKGKKRAREPEDPVESEPGPSKRRQMPATIEDIEQFDGEDDDFEEGGDDVEDKEEEGVQDEVGGDNEEEKASQGV
ncbi:hypothetical protein BDN72DRAFT_894458 [Pluteus cervinus]|uniref:Uncharacterized protein n=1 Tax=Pluteus cervinus TaxID=181527 RepID=A0ACD3B4R7_9AGAR|nr:hypothetical protein BDN72DRAFT_894458 [Pluteus cervinus]